MAVAYQYCTGRVDVYVAYVKPDWKRGSLALQRGYSSTSGALPGDAAYLGSCEQYPMVKGGENWSPWFADVTGDMEPLDWFFGNEFRVLVLPMNKVVGNVMEQILNKSSDLRTTGPDRKVGYMLQANGLFISLWLRFDNYFNGVKASGAVPSDMPPGEFYPCVRVPQKSLGPMGTLTRLNTLVCRTTPLYNLAANTTLVSSTDPAKFQGLPEPDAPGGGATIGNGSSFFSDATAFINSLTGG